MKKLLLTCVSVFAFTILFAQSVGVGTTAPNASAMLDVTSTNKGFLPPRVALTSVTDLATIASPVAGLLVYNTATAGTTPNNVTPGYYYYTGAAWYRISNPGNASGDMQYWNGKSWVNIAAGANGLNLTICNGVPQWGPCGAVTTTAPIVNTGSPTFVSTSTATTAGEVVADGGATLTARGVCYGVNANPTILVDSVRTNATLTTGTYTISLSNLTPSTTYHVRAFATNSVGTSYGGDSTFTTAAISAPFVTTTAAFGIGSNNANSGGNITGSGGSTITARGIVYSTSLNPSLASGTVITDPATTTGSFTSIISGLTPNTLYHVRAYATNAIGTSYGSDLTFTTLGNGAFAATYAFDGVTATSGTTDPSAPPVVTGLIFGSFSAVGVTGNSSGAGRFSLSGWTSGATNGSDVFTSVSDSTTKYYEVTITPDQGSSMTLTSVTFKFQRSSTGVRQAFIRSSADAFANNLTASISPANATLSVVPTNKFQVTDATSTAQDGCTITLSGNGYTSLTTPVTFRFYGINAESTGGTFSIDNVVFSGVVQ